MLRIHGDLHVKNFFFFLITLSYSSFNRDLNRGCSIYMFSLPFPGSKFLIIYDGNFVYVKYFRVRMEI